MIEKDFFSEQGEVMQMYPPFWQEIDQLCDQIYEFDRRGTYPKGAKAPPLLHHYVATVYRLICQVGPNAGRVFDWVTEVREVGAPFEFGQWPPEAKKLIETEQARMEASKDFRHRRALDRAIDESIRRLVGDERARS